MTTPYLTPPVFSWPAAPGGKLHTYLAGGTVAQATYSDAAGVTPNTNPVTLDSLGSAVVRLAVGVAYHVVLKDATDTTTLFDADNIDNNYLSTAAGIGAVLYPQTAAEIAAGVTPSNYTYAPYNLPRYGTVTGTNDSTMVSNWLKSAKAAGAPATNSLGAVTLAIAPIVFSSANNNIPPAIYLNGATLKAAAGASGVLVLIENPHLVWNGFVFDGGGGSIDANNLCSTAMQIHGSQHCNYLNFDCINSTGVGLDTSGEAGFGVYYNKFVQVRGGRQGSPNATFGIQARSFNNAGSYYNAANTFDTCQTQWNTGSGWKIDYANNTYLGCDAEQNGIAGINWGWFIDHTFSTDVDGGYSENNGSSAYVVHVTANAGGVRFTGRHIGGTDPADAANWQTVGMIYNVGQDTNAITVDAAGRFYAQDFKARTGGLGLNGAAPASNTINFSSGLAAALQSSGTNIFNWSTSLITSFKPMLVNNTNCRDTAGAGSPEGVVTANIGSTYRRSDGGALTSFYVKESGAGNVGWIAK